MEACIEQHRVVIYDRGGRQRVEALVYVSEIEYGRGISTTVLGKIIVSGEACIGQADVLRKIAARRHEVAIYRGDQRVFEGPILRVSWLADKVTILAHDVTAYLQGTPLSKDWPNADGGGQPLMTERVREILEYELTEPYVMELNTGGATTVERWETIDPPANVLPHLDVRYSDSLLTRSNTIAFEMPVLEHLNNLAEGGLDYTAIGRKVLVWDSAQEIGRTKTLTEADFYGPIEVISDGADFAAIAHVSAQREEGEVIDPTSGVGSAGRVDPFYGVWTVIHTLASEEGSDEPTQFELNTQALRVIRGRNPVPVVVAVPAGSGLKLSHDLRINDLVPGVIIPVRALLGLKRIAQDQRLTKLTVKETPAGETVQVDLEPSGGAYLV